MSSTGWTAGVLDRYRSGGLAGRLTPGSSPAVVVVDLQDGFTDPACGPGFELGPVVAGTRRLLDAARAAGVPVLFTTIAFPAAARSTWLRKMPVLAELVEGSGRERIDPRLAPRAGEPVLVKQNASAFAGTELAGVLAGYGADSLIVCGATTSGCVRATVVDACAADLPTFVVRECVGDREHGPHDAALLDLDAKYADVISLDRALELLAAVPAGRGVR
ncbi:MULTISPECIES: isochorismatase family protein [unclassified Geodermatophilus]|uniref:isochorismatase family protein n=1 Tax=unclassified Geodermatophilus TaxID=2637632 RepID=UPI003EEADEC6